MRRRGPAILATAVLAILPLAGAGAQFVPPPAVLQASYPAGLRAYIPDFPGCERFSFHGKINSPFGQDDEPGTFFQDILHPTRGFWTFHDPKIVLTPGDKLYYWTLVVKDGTEYPMKNLTWEVPDIKDFVEILSPISPSPPRTPQSKMTDTEPTPTEDETTPEPEPTSLSDEETNTSETTSPSTETKPTLKTTTKPPTTPVPKTEPKKSTPAPNPTKLKDVEELTTPATSMEPPMMGGFPGEPPSLFPFPSLYPSSLKPTLSPIEPDFEICSNPWNFEPQPGESRTQRLERQVAKLQCQLALSQRGFSRLSNSLEQELLDMKKLIYGMVSRMSRLESALRSTIAFG